MPTDKRARQKAARQAKLEAQRRAAQRRQLIRRVALVGIIAVVVVGSVAIFASSSSKPTPVTNPNVPADQATVNLLSQRAGCPSSTTQTVNTLSWKSAPPMTISASKSYYVHMLTTQGPIVFKLEPKIAPITVNNFIFLATHKFYNCVVFHRVIPGFAVQGGDPTGTGGGGPGYAIADEWPKVRAGNPIYYPLYSVAMANGGAHTTGSQFFFVTGQAGEKLTPNYSLFGQVVSGTRAINFISQGGDYNSATEPPSADGTTLITKNRILSISIQSTP